MVLLALNCFAACVHVCQVIHDTLLAVCPRQWLQPGYNPSAKKDVGAAQSSGGQAGTPAGHTYYGVMSNAGLAVIDVLLYCSLPAWM